MPWLEDLMTLIEDAGIVTRLSRRLISGSPASIATDLVASGVLSVREYPGAPALRTHNTISPPAYVRPNAQLIATASSYPVARTLSLAARNAVEIRNQFINSGWYQEITPLQEPFDLGVDERGNARVAFNVRGIKRP